MNRVRNTKILFSRLFYVPIANLHVTHRAYKIDQFYVEEPAARVDPKLPFYIRLDGNSFGQLVKRKPGFKLPWDEKFHNAMMLTGCDLFLEYNPICVYSFSDEFTLAFLPPKEPSIYPNAGRIQKLISCTAGFASARFNFHLNNQNYDSEPELGERVKSLCAYFDSRLYTVEDDSKLFENLRWRQTDCNRNSKSVLSYVYLPKRQRPGKAANQLISMVLNEHGIDWNLQPLWYKKGFLLKKQFHDKQCINKATGEPVIATRTRVVNAIKLLDLPYDETEHNFCNHLDKNYEVTDDEIIEAGNYSFHKTEEFKKIQFPWREK